MDEYAIGFAYKHRICVLTTVLPSGTPHSATLHYATTKDPLSFVVFTDRNSRKCDHFEDGKKYPASLVVGFSEEEFTELQAEGEVYLIQEKKELEEAWKEYAKKYPGSDSDTHSKKWILLKFVPNWWRYTEFKPKYKVISSEDSK